MAQQTSVEWLSEKLNEFNGEDNPWFDIPLSILEQAKEMHKAEIETAYDKVSMLTAEEYYNETYKND
jgi:hypothetical protein